MKAIAVLLLLCVAVAHSAYDSRKRRPDKIYLADRPVKEKGLWEKSPELNLDESSELEKGTDDFDWEPPSSEETSEENNVWPWNIDDILRKTNERIPDFDEVQKRFSEIWGNIFGSSEEVEEEEGAVVATNTETEETSQGAQKFVSKLFNLLQPWWKGENVCKREETYEEENSDEQPSFFSSLSTQCQDLGDVYKCTMKIGKEGKTQVRTLIYECCHGFGRQNGKKGCPQSLELKDLSSTLEDMNLTRFIDTAESIGLNAKLDAENFTIFVPTNEALTSITNSDEFNFVVLETNDKLQFVRDILLAHMVPGWKHSHQWEDEMVLPTEKDGSGIRINYYSYPRPFVTANCARVTETDRRTTGGLIHTVDRVLIPARQSLWDMVSQDTRFSIFSSLVSTGLQDKLMDPNGHYTVLAFTDEAFHKLPEDIKFAIQNKTFCTTDLISDMILPNTICTTAIYGQVHVQNLAKRLLNATRVSPSLDNVGQGQTVEFGGIPVSVSDRMATNGVMHVLDGVILPDHVLDIVRVTERNGGEVFAELVKTTGHLKREIQELSHASFFVPPNSALLDLPEEIQTDEEKRKELLKNHIVDNLVEIGYKNPETILRTMADREVTLTTRRSPLMMTFHSFGRRTVTANIGCARIIKSNVRSCGGYVHFLDRILKIPTHSMMPALRANPDYSEFVTLLEMSEVDKDIDRDDFTGTILVPTNTAMNLHFPEETKAELLDNKEKLKTFMRRHILQDSVCCHSFGTGLWFQPTRHRTLTGIRLPSSTQGSNKKIGGARITNCDIEGINGIIHTIDRPIFRSRASALLDIFDN